MPVLIDIWPGAPYCSLMGGRASTKCQLRCRKLWNRSCFPNTALAGQSQAGEKKIRNVNAIVRTTTQDADFQQQISKLWRVFCRWPNFGLIVAPRLVSIPIQ